MTIIEQLDKWSKKTGGTAETVSTITLNTEQMNLVVHGVSLEDAYEKIKEVCSDFNTEAKEETEVKEEVKPNPSTAPVNPVPNLNSVDLNLASTQTLAQALGSRKLVKIYTPGTVLEPGEQVLKYQNTEYVVK
jgi:hypothetical protein